MESGKWEYEGLGFMYVCAQFHPWTILHEMGSTMFE
jgi:hypothetical protein